MIMKKFVRTTKVIAQSRGFFLRVYNGGYVRINVAKSTRRKWVFNVDEKRIFFSQDFLNQVQFFARGNYSFGTFTRLTNKIDRAAGLARVRVTA